MRNTVAVILVFGIVAYAVDAYMTKFDNINVDQILRNERLLNPYIDCLLRDVKCTAEGKELKRLLPEVFTTNCLKCNDKQKTDAEKVVSYLAKSKPQVLNEVLKRYDKDNVFRTQYAESAKRLGVAI
ncbi:ejaculatory bulb-specific protein 3-like [Copidosoma floridanum]|uniref:ejaculatory bulb-specific protein 3-like n=1 Tax=Copidosoma floridanum TaxID=29053 RepID=UPI0006C9C3BA|nr:ejaculatory bulb-specific protein 3-like [Copidosoma floridanum]XP_014215652.1 ejaculatory bulb-specific protein 3-like [Copidosoma floridanum]XP_023246973.1 ejaculatory bulb-specific protein 3-like [Copidosoma floridanum]